MKRLMRFLPMVILFLCLLVSCKKETKCDTAAYAPPEMTLVDPEGLVIEAVWDVGLDFEFTCSAEAGLNTFSMRHSVQNYYAEWHEPIWLFTKGETEATIRFSRYFWESGELEFVLHDLCNQSTSLTVQLVVSDPPQL